jgi:hypothetical protein
MTDRAQGGAPSAPPSPVWLEQALARSTQIAETIAAEHERNRLREERESFRLIVAGYVFAALPILVFPNLMAQVAVALGVATVVKGRAIHGIAIMAIAVATAIVGVLIGGAGVLG